MVLFTSLEQPAPMLEHLEVYTLWRDSSENIECSVTLPQLRHLTLVGCAVTWTLSSFENLRSLNISRLPEAIKPTIGQFLRMLRRTPLLESFSIKSIKQSSEDRDTPSQRKPVSLKYLAYMEVSCILSDCVYLLDHLEISGRKVREITLNIENTPSSQIHLAKDLARTIESKFDGRVQKLVLDDTLRLRISEQSCSHSCTVVVNFIGEGPQYRASFWQSLHLDRLSSLEVWEDHFSAQQWSIFGGLPGLKTITVSPEKDHLLRALIQETAITPSLAFPALKRLAMGDWDVLSKESDLRREMVDQMVSCLKLRHSAGLALDCLRLNNCFKDDEDGDESVAAILGRLREFVKDVQTDQYDESDDE
ncbi:hypothetical protein C0993_003823 [Termitomyces sp. T159_Od127]|nr:hypothetical protein C0993_003823 [Termitomyces sp. T159_Od127]